MTKPEVIKLLAIIAAAYPNMKEVNEVQINIWYDCLKDIDVKVALTAIKKHILESTFPPSIADIRKQVAEITMPETAKLDGTTAWGEVLKAIKEYGYYREEEALANMSPMTAKVVKYMGWREICLSEQPDVIRGQFLKMYEILSNREKQDRLLPLDFKQNMEQIANTHQAIKQLADTFSLEQGD